MKLPRGQLVRKRVVSSLGTALSNAFDASLTGYARLESQDALLLDADGVGVLTFEDGVPVVAYHTGTDSSGQDALADIAVPGPYLLELYRLDADVLSEVHATEELRIPPETPAERLAGNQQLAERTRKRAPSARLTGTDTEEPEEASAVESFLDDEEKISAIQERAREEAQERAAEWGFKR
jgi:hypothetical protein